ncbi:MAG: phosphoglucomutase/phosphomannomutase family protein [Bacteroidetes bacterium]|nr:phosphoglucomutase/phosphomannomutase family protein [Bacteroidota bacterium]MBU1423582.1 phosphoglucomutase/phosphomannomutase family protein [Bacteroidota bacterium]MBU2635894.1 phosphoglucomutase/phosphomannomutase family protein [Bacteroidota bacterium]
MSIKFGTDGWRGVIAEDFTFENLEKVALATALNYKRHKNIKKGIVVGYDARFLSREFAERVATVLANNNISVTISDSISSTPMISLLTRKLKAAAGIVITASHNPPMYSGYKIKGDFGGPAFPETIEKVERHLAPILNSSKRIDLKKSFTELVQAGKIKYIDMTKIYLDDIKKKLNIGLIKKSSIRILHDAMYGAGMNVFTQIVPDCQQIHATFNPSFEGINPEPIEINLTELKAKVKLGKFDIGIATDGDADRLGVVDEKGNYVDPHRVFSLLLKYLVEEKKLKGEVAKSFTVTDIVDKQCAKYGIKLHTTPVGFKYICQLMNERKIIIGGEESGGLGVFGHIPERDGVYLGLLIGEIIVKRKKKLSELVKELEKEFGPRVYKRIDHHTTPKEKTLTMKRFKPTLKEIAGFRVKKVETIDGFKFYVDNGWMLVRASGTEPLVRYYAEADSEQKARKMLDWAIGK